MEAPGLNMTLDANQTELMSSCDEDEGLVLEVAVGNKTILHITPASKTWVDVLQA